MHDGQARQGLRQRVSQIFLWFLGGRQTRDQYTQRARHHGVAQVFHWLRAGAQTRAQYRHSTLHQADGVVRGLRILMPSSSRDGRTNSSCNSNKKG